jgi:hypothetical protein
MNKLSIINFANEESLAILREFLQQHDFQIFEIDGATVKDGESFIAQAMRKLPQDPPQGPEWLPVGEPHWDAFVDSFIGGLAHLESEWVAVVWTSVENMLDYGLSDLIIATSCFEQVIHTVAQAKYGFPQRMNLFVFLVGKGANFKPFSGDI